MWRFVHMICNLDGSLCAHKWSLHAQGVKQASERLNTLAACSPLLAGAISSTQRTSRLPPSGFVQASRIPFYFSFVVSPAPVWQSLPETSTQARGPLPSCSCSILVLAGYFEKDMDKWWDRYHGQRCVRIEELHPDVGSASANWSVSIWCLAG